MAAMHPSLHTTLGVNPIQLSGAFLGVNMRRLAWVRRRKAWTGHPSRGEPEEAFPSALIPAPPPSRGAVSLSLHGRGSSQLDGRLRRAMAGGLGLALALLALAPLRFQETRADQELRFKPAPRDRPVRLFTEAELARYNGQEVQYGEWSVAKGCPLAAKGWDSCKARQGLNHSRRRGAFPRLLFCSPQAFSRSLSSGSRTSLQGTKPSIRCCF